MAGDGVLLGEAAAQQRPDVADVHPWIAHAGTSGFLLHQETGVRRGGAIAEVEVRGFGSSGKVVSLAKSARVGGSLEIPVPPRHLFQFIGSPDAGSFVSQGLEIYGDIVSALRRYDDPQRFRSVLDWGCGCGRLSYYLIGTFPHVTGCDVVPEAVDWCRRHFPEARFLCIEEDPPTPFADRSFDLVLASSVFTHLDEKRQARWLGELNRLLRPGGLLVASVLGRYAFLRDMSARSTSVNRIKAFLLRRRFDKKGIAENYRGLVFPHRKRFHGLRDTYQQMSYTLRQWSRQFRILAYIERGLSNYQDLVLLQRDPSAGGGSWNP